MRRPKTNLPPKPTGPTNAERFWAGIYGALITRFMRCPPDWSVAVTAAKLYAKRVGLDHMLDMLVTHGTAVVAERCRHEMTVRQQFMAHMLATYPSDDIEEAEGAIEEMAHDLAVIDSPEGAMRLLRYLERLRQRELLRNLADTTVH